MGNASINVSSGRGAGGAIIAGNNTFYGTSPTAASTATKVVNLLGVTDGFARTTGVEIIVKFAVTNTASSPQLNVSGTGGSPIFYRGAAIAAGSLVAGRTYKFVFNGTQYDFIGDIGEGVTFATQTEVNAGTVTNKALYPAHKATESNIGTVQLATQTEVNTGTVDDKTVTPKTLAEKLKNIDKMSVLQPTSSTATSLNVTISGITSYNDLVGKVIYVRKGTNSGAGTGLTININSYGNVNLSRTLVSVSEVALTTAFYPYQFAANSVLAISFISASVAVVINADTYQVASDTQRGLVELATTAETQAGESTNLAVTPAGLASVLSNWTPNISWMNLTVANNAVVPDNQVARYGLQDDVCHVEFVVDVINMSSETTMKPFLSLPEGFRPRHPGISLRYVAGPTIPNTPYGSGTMGGVGTEGMIVGQTGDINLGSSLQNYINTVSRDNARYVRAKIVYYV